MTTALTLPVATALRQRCLTAGTLRANLQEVGSGPARLLWLPALLDRAATFTRASLALASRMRGAVCVGAIDPPGYGASGTPMGVELPEFRVLEQWIGAILDQLPGPKILVGNSSGSVPVLAAAHRPDVAGIALAGWCDWRLVGPPPRDILCPHDAPGLDRLLALGWHSRPDVPAAILDEVLATTRSRAYREHVASFDAQRFGRNLDAYAGPLLLVCGTSDGVTSPAMVRRLANSRPDAELHWITRCGHYPHREAPAQLAQIVAPWALRSLEKYAAPLAQRKLSSARRTS